MHAAANYFLESDARGFVFLRIDLDPRLCASLQLLAALCRENDQTILRINFRSSCCFHFIRIQFCL